MTAARSAISHNSQVEVSTFSSRPMNSGHPEMMGVAKQARARNRIANNKGHIIALSHMVLNRQRHKPVFVLLLSLQHAIACAEQASLQRGWHRPRRAALRFPKCASADERQRTARQSTSCQAQCKRPLTGTAYLFATLGGRESGKIWS